MVVILLSLHQNIVSLNEGGTKLPYFFDMLTDSIRQQIAAFLAEHHPDVFIVEMDMNQGNRTSLSLLIDNDNGIRLEQITAVAKSLGPWLDESEIFDYDHGLEISSPGATEPLRIWRQYPKNIGRELLIKTTEGKEILGLLEEVSEANVNVRLRQNKKPVKGRPIKYEEELLEIPFENIIQASVHIK